MVIAQILIAFVLNVITGFSLGVLYFLRKVKKIQKKTRSLLNENQLLIEEQKNTPELETLDRTIALASKIHTVGGRIDVISELFD